jgi:hypothetical protein
MVSYILSTYKRSNSSFGRLLLQHETFPDGDDASDSRQGKVMLQHGRR